MFELLLEEAPKYFKKEEIALIKKAHEYASKKHEGVLRESNEPYITHPEYVAYILLFEMHLHDLPSIIAAILHDVLEDTNTTYEEIKDLFGLEVANLVLGVTKINNLNFTTKTENEKYNTCLLLRKCLDDYRIILIKLADRLHNMRTLNYKKEAIKREKKSLETLEVFVPLALSIGAYQVKRELEDIAFKYLFPSDYEHMRSMKDDYLNLYVEKIDEIRDNIINQLLAHHISNEVTISFKNLYSLFTEIKAKQKLSSIHDLIAYHITLSSIDDCYRTLGIIHENYPNIKGYLKDYLFTPKPNGYRSIHTTVCGFKSEINAKEHYVQFQISTKKMSLINNYGFAVLEDLYPHKTINEIQDYLHKNTQVFLSLEEIKTLYKQDNEFLKQVYEEILNDQIEVYSKDGHVYTLPIGATVLDFAYKIHSEVGNTASYALVNGLEVPLDFILKEGDKIEVISTNKLSQEANALNYVKTALAKKKIKEGLKLTRNL